MTRPNPTPHGDSQRPPKGLKRCRGRGGRAKEIETGAGLVINVTKSLLEPVQQLEALCLELDVRKGLLLVPHHKRKGYRREAGKFLTMKVITPRKVAVLQVF